MHLLRHFSLSLGHTGLALCSWEISCYLTSLKACHRFSSCLSLTLVAVSLYQAMVTALSRIRSGFICSFIDRLAPAVWLQSCRGSIRYVCTVHVVLCQAIQCIGCQQIHLPPACIDWTYSFRVLQFVYCTSNFVFTRSSFFFFLLAKLIKHVYHLLCLPLHAQP